MTRRRDFKQRVRARMAKTGERYTTARAHLLGELTRTAPPRARHDQTFALRRLLDARRGLDLDEAWLLGLGGGISAQYHTFEYRGMAPLVYVGTRCNPQYAYDERFVTRALTGLGFEARVWQATSARKAAGQLVEALADGPALCWVGREALMGQPSPGGATPWVVLVHDIDGQTAAVEDCAAGQLEIDLTRLAAARAAVKPQKHRLIGLAGAGRDGVGDGIWRGVRHCVEDLEGGVVLGGSAKNFGLAALEKWAGLADHPRDPKGWPKLFGGGRRLLAGLRQVWVWVHHGTGGGGFRPMYAEFLGRAAAQTGSTALAEAGQRIAENGQRWQALTGDLFAGSPPVLGAALAHLERCDTPQDPGALAHLDPQADAELDGAFARDVHGRLAVHLRGLVGGERAALAALRAAVGAHAME